MRALRITRSGVIVDLLDPGATPGLTVEDLAWALDGVIRWGGHGCRRISVCQHSVVMARAALELMPGEPLLALACQWHDCEEPFTGDLTTELKHAPEMAWYREQCDRVRDSLICRFEPALIDFDWSRVKFLDRASLRAESRIGFPYTADFHNHDAFREHRGDTTIPVRDYLLPGDHFEWLNLRTRIRHVLGETDQ